MSDGDLEQTRDAPAADVDITLEPRPSEAPTLHARSHTPASVLETLDAGTAPRPAGPPMLDGSERRFGRFRTLAKLGEGGMGVVLAAHDEQLDRKVALKFLLRTDGDSVARERLFREARSLARLSHPNIVAVYDVGEIDDMPYLAMELVEGRTLSRWIAGDDEQPPPPRIDVLHMFLAVGRGLAAAHELGVVHRDFKPDNVLVGDDGRPRVVDFGLASIGRGLAREREQLGREQLERELAAADANMQSLTATGAIMGTPAYMAPEQWYGQAADARSDQFSFCVALFTALYGHAPFEGESMAALMAAVLEHEPREVAVTERVPTALHTAILRGLAREPEQRWPSLAALLEHIEAALAEVQPGLFTAAPTPIIWIAPPLLLGLPLLLLALEAFDIIPYANTNWVWLSSVQVLLMTAAAFVLRRRLLQFLGDRRMLFGPALMALFVLGHRVIAAATHSSFDSMFAYDFLALTGLTAAVVGLADRTLWPALGLPLTLLLLSIVEPSWGPRLWAAFTIGMPPIVAATVLRTRDRLRNPSKS